MNAFHGEFHHSLDPSTSLVDDSPSGALPVFAPTRATFAHHHEHKEAFIWTARNHRKQRHVAVSPRTGRSRHVTGPWRIAKMAQLEYWNVSWWVAVMFTLGSVVWVINGFIVFLPFVSSVAKDPVGGGWSAWVGATIFEAGSLLLIIEAWNRDDVAGFGKAVEEIFGNARFAAGNGKNADVSDSEQDTRSPPNSQWLWWSANPKYWRELGFVAGFVQLCAASVFWISGFTGLPEIQDVLLKHPAALDGIYWTPQVVGGTGFIVSSALYMLETQKRWYVPTFSSLGWHIGFWNFIGAIGFTLCGALGYSTSSGAMYQSSLSTFWGGWAFLIGSIVQWYEAVNPVRTPE